MRFHYRMDDRDVQLDISRRGDGYAVTLDGQELDVEVLSAQPGELHLRCGEQRSRAYVAVRGDDRFVFLNGRVFSFRRPADIHELEEENGNGGPHVVSQMPCTIVKLLVQPGQQVAEGDGLLIIESMKMETEITAPLAGSVATVHVRQGETVGLRAPLVDLDPMPPAGET